MPPAISVIVTSYNYARFIGEAIQGVLDQTCQDFEVIVVDDGSTDDTRSVLDRFGDRITCIYQANQGKSIALNRGIAVSRGRYLAFLDSDDCWLPDSLEARLATFKADPEVGVVYGRALVVDEAGRPLPYTIGAPERYPDETFRSLLYGVFIPFVTFMVRRESFEQAGAYFDPGFGTTNDWELYLRLSRVCRFRYLDHPLARYRLHASNWSCNPLVMAEQMTRLVERALSDPHLPPEVKRTRYIVYRNLYTNIGLGFVGPGPRRLALQYFTKALSVSRNPIWTAVRIAYLILVGYLNRSRLGAWAVSELAMAKQRLNYALGR